MNETKFVKELTQAAINSMSYTDNEYPCLSIDKQECEKYNIETIKSELAKLDFTLVDIVDAPEPHKNKYLNRWFIYKEKELYNRNKKSTITPTKQRLTRTKKTN